jgi:hypothetical protein
MAETNRVEEIPVTELAVFDPAETDGLYWKRFHRTVMERAGAELARRREAVSLTLSGALTGWARLVVPAAAAAAALAALFLVQEPRIDRTQVVVDDILEVPSAIAESEAEFSATFSALAAAENF